MRARAVLGVLLLFLALFAYLSFDAENTSTEAIHASAGAAAVLTSTSDRNSRRALRNIIRLKAYAYTAFNTVYEYTEKHKKESKTALVPLLLKLGAKDFRRSGNIVVEFARVTGNLMSTYQHGLGAYIIQHVNGEVLKRDGIVHTKPCSHVPTLRTKKGLCTLLMYKAMGFKKRPLIFSKLAVPFSEYSKHKLKLAQTNKHAGVEAAAAWLKAGMQTQYVETFSREFARDTRKRQLQERKEVRGAYLAEVQAMRRATAARQSKTKKLFVMPPAGAMGGAAVRRHSAYYKNRPTMKVLVAKANKASRQWAKRKQWSLSQLVRLTQRKMTGVTVRFTTKMYPWAESAQTPFIKIYGTKNQLIGRLRALPLQGQSLTQTFSSTGIGKLLKIKLVASAHDPWLCAKMDVKVGNSKWVAMTQKEFWLDAKPYSPPYHHFRYSNRWILKPPSPPKPLTFGSQITLNSVNNHKFLTARSNNLKANAKVAAVPEVFTIVRPNIKAGTGGGQIRYGDKVALKSASGKFVTAQANGRMNANHAVIKSMGIFTIVQAQSAKRKGRTLVRSGPITLRSRRGIVTAGANGRVHADKNKLPAAQAFKVGVKAYFLQAKPAAVKSRPACLYKQYMNTNMPTSLVESGSFTPIRGRSRNTSNGSSKVWTRRTYCFQQARDARNACNRIKSCQGFTDVGARKGGLIRNPSNKRYYQCRFQLRRGWSHASELVEVAATSTAKTSQKYGHTAGVVAYRKKCPTSGAKMALLGMVCQTRKIHSSSAGVVRSAAAQGFIMVGGGLVNKHHKFNKAGAFEESLPEGNSWRCDTGFGPGSLDCYVRACKLPKRTKCITRSKSSHGGVVQVKLPAGYTMVGGGVNNRLRRFNSKGTFVQSFPSGNAWRCKTGLRNGRTTCYVRGCKFPSGSAFQTIKTRLHSPGNAIIMQSIASCPAGYRVLSCGMHNKHNKFDRLSTFIANMPISDTQCLCKTGFGKGSLECYARCGKA